MSNFIKIRPEGSEWFHADRRTDRHDEANKRFSQLCECVYKLICRLSYSFILRKGLVQVKINSCTPERIIGSCY